MEKLQNWQKMTKDKYKVSVQSTMRLSTNRDIYDSVKLSEKFMYKNSVMSSGDSSVGIVANSQKNLLSKLR